MTGLIDRAFRWVKVVLGSARVVVDKADEAVEGVQEEIRKSGKEKEKPARTDDR